MTKFDQFWPLYLHAHRRRGTRAAHYVGILYGTAMTALAAASWNVWPLIAGVAGAFAVTVGSHWVFEGRRPLLVGNPLFAAAADIRMFLLAAAGRLAPEFARHGIEAEAASPRIKVRRGAARTASSIAGIMLVLAALALSLELTAWLREGAWQPISVESALRHWGVVLTEMDRALADACRRNNPLGANHRRLRRLRGVRPCPRPLDTSRDEAPTVARRTAAGHSLVPGRRSEIYALV
jgi:hypothetical protein